MIWKRHHPGIDAAPDSRVAAGWKQRITSQTSRSGTDGETRDRCPGQPPRPPGPRPVLLPRHRPVGGRRPGPLGSVVAPCPVRDAISPSGKNVTASHGWTQRTRERCRSCPSCSPPSTGARRAPAAAPGRPGRRPGRAFTAGGADADPVRPPARISGEDLGRETRHRQAPRPDPRRTPGILDLGCRAHPARYRHPHRGTHRAVSSQPDPIPAAGQRRGDPAAADRPVQDRHREAPGHQARAG